MTDTTYDPISLDRSALPERGSLTRHELISRGWTHALIRTLLGEPHFSTDRIMAAEASDSFRARLGRVAAEERRMGVDAQSYREAASRVRGRVVLDVPEGVTRRTLEHQVLERRHRSYWPGDYEMEPELLEELCAEADPEDLKAEVLAELAEMTQNSSVYHLYLEACRDLPPTLAQLEGMAHDRRYRLVSGCRRRFEEVLAPRVDEVAREALESLPVTSARPSC